MGKFVRLLALLFVLNSSDAQLLEDPEPEWLKPKWSHPVAERQFDSYFDVRLTSNGTHLNRTVYKTSWNEQPINYGSEIHPVSEIDGKPQFHNRMFTYKWAKQLVLIQINEASGYIRFSTENQELGKLMYKSFWNAWFFVFDKILFVGEDEAYDLDVLLSSKFVDPDTAFLKYENIPSTILSGKKLQQVKTECFKSFQHCSQNFDKKGDIVLTHEQSQGKQNSIYLYADLHRGIVDKYHYCLQHESNQTTWYFPKNLTVSKFEPEGIRINLYPIIQEHEHFSFGADESGENEELTTIEKADKNGDVPKPKKKKCKRRRNNGNLKQQTPVFAAIVLTFWTLAFF